MYKNNGTEEDPIYPQLAVEEDEEEEEYAADADGNRLLNAGHTGPESCVLEYEEDEEEEEEDEGEEGEEEEEEFQKIRREHVFAEIDFTKRKSKIIATLG